MFESTPKEHGGPGIFFLPAIEIAMAIATGTSQVVADLGVGIAHQATSEPLMVEDAVVDSSSHCVAGAKPSRLSREMPFTTA